VDEGDRKPAGSPGGPPPVPRPGPGDEAHAAARQRTIDALCEAFANDELEVEEFERRVESAHRAATADDLRRLLAGLPSASVPAAVPRKGQAKRPLPAQAPAPDPTQVPELYQGEVREWSLSLGLMGGMSRTGYWVPARKNVVIGMMGGCDIDLRDAQLPAGVTEIICVAFWGGVEVIVPPWLQVEVSGIGIMGGFDHNQKTRPTPVPGGPVLRVSGLALMGGVGVTVRYPGESAGDARRRLKEEKKDRRLSRGRSQDLDDEDEE
jgi:hypothetical protein